MNMHNTIECTGFDVEGIDLCMPKGESKKIFKEFKYNYTTMQ